MNTTLNFSKKVQAILSLVIFIGMGLLSLKAQTYTNGDKDLENTAVRTAFQNTKKIRAGLLDVGYAEVGPENGKPVILLHGWPYDIIVLNSLRLFLLKKGTAF